MYRFILTLLRILAAWPVLLLLLIAMGFLFMLGTGLQERERAVAALLNESVAIRQTIVSRKASLDSFEMTDLRLRFEAFASDFIDATNDPQARLLELAETYSANVKWSIDQVEIESQSELLIGSRNGFLRSVITASMPLEIGQVPRLEADRRLPSLSALRFGRQFWRVPPYKEFDYLLLERGEEAYRLELGLYLPTWAQPAAEEGDKTDG
jgi:hypothetical protein